MFAPQKSIPSKSYDIDTTNSTATIYILYSLLSFGLYFTTSDIPNNQRIFKIHLIEPINKWHVRCLLHSCSHPLQAPATSGQLLLSDGHAYKLLPKEAIQQNPSVAPPGETMIPVDGNQRSGKLTSWGEGSLSHYLQGFLYIWGGAEFLNHQP